MTEKQAESRTPWQISDRTSLEHKEGTWFCVTIVSFLVEVIWKLVPEGQGTGCQVEGRSRCKDQSEEGHSWNESSLAGWGRRGWVARDKSSSARTKLIWGAFLCKGIGVSPEGENGDPMTTSMTGDGNVTHEVAARGTVPGGLLLEQSAHWAFYPEQTPEDVMQPVVEVPGDSAQGGQRRGRGRPETKRGAWTSESFTKPHNVLN